MSMQPFIVAGYPVDMAAPPLEQPFEKLGPALERAAELASALGYRSAVVMDRHNTVFAQFNLLWSVPRELR